MANGPLNSDRIGASTAAKAMSTRVETDDDVTLSCPRVAG
jgi:hypothetical protein